MDIVAFWLETFKYQIKIQFVNIYLKNIFKLIKYLYYYLFLYNKFIHQKGCLAYQ